MQAGGVLLTISSVKEHGSVTPQVPATFGDFMTYRRLRALTMKLEEQLPVLVDDFCQCDIGLFPKQLFNSPDMNFRAKMLGRDLS